MSCVESEGFERTVEVRVVEVVGGLERKGVLAQAPAALWFGHVDGLLERAHLRMGFGPGLSEDVAFRTHIFDVSIAVIYPVILLVVWYRIYFLGFFV